LTFPKRLSCIVISIDFVLVFVSRSYRGTVPSSSYHLSINYFWIPLSLLPFRRKQLENLLRCYEEHENEIISALEADLRRPKQESLIVETEFMKNDIKHILFHLDEWVQSEKVYYQLYYTPSSLLILTYYFVAPQALCEPDGRCPDLQ